MPLSAVESAEEVLRALEALDRSIDELDDETLVRLSGVAGALQRVSGTFGARIAGELARRSAREFGQDGLAQRLGFRTPEELVRSTTGVTARSAATSVRVGTLPDWLSPVSEALDTGLSVDAADAIRNGLGKPTADIDEKTLTDAAARLCREARDLDADRLQRRARELRDELDDTGVADREAARHDARSLRFTRLPNGMSMLTWILDPESAAIVADLYDRATSPRRGGPRFVGADDQKRSADITDDTRTTEQLGSDVFLELLRQGSAADSSALLGSGAPVLRVITDRRTERGYIEGQPDPISTETLDRLVCAGSTQPILVDENRQPVDVGREQRLFTRCQRIVLAARDGGCRWPGCSRPPSWCEAHHIAFWARDRGGTDVANGILLCRHHHLLLHNKRWEIRRDGPRYWLVPPTAVDAARTPRPMPSASAWLAEPVTAR